jgi:uncharacterized protein
VKVIADTGPLVAAANRRDEAHELAAVLVVEMGRDLVIPSFVLVEADYLLRTRVGVRSARSLLRAVAAGEHTVAYMTPDLLRRAADIDERFDELDLGLTDAAVMAIAEREQAPVLTFDFEDFRAAPSDAGPWQLVIDESRYRDSIR